jgi:hypothetical protein
VGTVFGYPKLWRRTGLPFESVELARPPQLYETLALWGDVPGWVDPRGEGTPGHLASPARGAYMATVKALLATLKGAGPERVSLRRRALTAAIQPYALARVNARVLEEETRRLAAGEMEASEAPAVERRADQQRDQQSRVFPQGITVHKNKGRLSCAGKGIT